MKTKQVIIRLVYAALFGVILFGMLALLASLAIIPILAPLPESDVFYLAFPLLLVGLLLASMTGAVVQSLFDK